MLRTEARPAFATCYKIAGRLLSVACVDEEIARWAARLVSDWYFAPVTGKASSSASSAEPTFTLEIKRGLPPRVPSGWHKFEVPYGQCHTNQIGSYIEVEGSACIVHPTETRRVEVWLNAALEGPLSIQLTRLFFYGVQAALRRCGLYEMHAAGAVQPESGKGALIIGASGSGKSTVAMRLAQCGWKYLNDDTVLLCETSDGVEARGFRRFFSLTETTATACALADFTDEELPAAEYDSGKLRLDPQSAFPSRRAAACVPRALFFATITRETTSRLVALAQHEAMAQLIRLCPWASYDAAVARPFLRVLAQLARQADAYLLKSGPDLLEQPCVAAELLGAPLRARR